MLRLEVGTESGLDRSKSVKSHVMRLLAAQGNHSVEVGDGRSGQQGSTTPMHVVMSSTKLKRQAL